MSKTKNTYPLTVPMRIQARQGSLAEKRYYQKSGLPGGAWPMPKAIAPGIAPSPLDDLIFHGGRVVPQMEFQNIYLGSPVDWQAGDIANIDNAIARAMSDRPFNTVMRQYFPGAQLACEARDSLILNDVKPTQLDEDDVRAKIVALFDSGQISKSDLDTTLFNLMLPPGCVLRLGDSTSLAGLGGFHGSIHIRRGSRNLTLYYSANVFSDMLSPTRENGIVVFDKPWKNVVATLVHEINEFRTDADVKDAIDTGDNDALGWTSRRGHECGDQPIVAAASLALVFKEIRAGQGGSRVPVQFMYSNGAHGAEGPIGPPAIGAAAAPPRSRTRAGTVRARSK